MRQISRLRPSVEAILIANPKFHQLPYVCRSCRVRAVATRRHASIMTLLKKKGTEDSGTNAGIQPKSAEAEEDESFVPASTWEGLEWIGTREWQEKTNVVEGHNFERWAGRERVTDPHEIKRCVKKALVAVIKARNKELGRFQDPNLEELTVDNIVYLQGTWGLGWTVAEQQTDWNFDLSDVDFRFAVVKKLGTISGIHLTDPAIMRIKNAYRLMEEVSVLPKPKKLIVRNPDLNHANELIIAGQTLAWKGAKSKLDLSLLNLPNVKVSERRISKEDQEKQIGRWKVIEEELKVRRLSSKPSVPNYGA